MQAQNAGAIKAAVAAATKGVVDSLRAVVTELQPKAAAGLPFVGVYPGEAKGEIKVVTVGEPDHKDFASVGMQMLDSCISGEVARTQAEVEAAEAKKTTVALAAARSDLGAKASADLKLALAEQARGLTATGQQQLAAAVAAAQKATTDSLSAKHSEVGVDVKVILTPPCIFH